MEIYKLGVVEGHFADIIWQHEPLASGDLVKLCNIKLKWKKSTTYTVLKKLCEKGVFKNEGGVVTSQISKEEYFSLQSEKIIEDEFEGSLPAFIAAFTSRKQLSKKEVFEIKRLIDSIDSKED